MTVATLSSHVNSDTVTREQLALVPVPVATSTFRPVPHIELVESLDKSLLKAGLNPLTEQLALRRDGQLLFGVKTVEGLDTPDGRGALGFRQANNKTMSIQIVAGLSVFVCDNLVFRGDMIALLRKHTSGLNLQDELDTGVGEFLNHFGKLKAEVDWLKKRELSASDAKAMIHDAFVKGLMPLRFLPEVSKTYFEPPHVEFNDPTAWSLHNAFTEVAKKMPVTTRMIATGEIGKFFGMVN